MMGSVLTLAWYNILLLTGVYSVVFSIIVRLLKVGHVLGCVLAISLACAYFTRDIVYTTIPFLPSNVCILFACVTLLISNFIVDFRVK
jgi:Mg/Co/Ni transporter MgtE